MPGLVEEESVEEEEEEEGGARGAVRRELFGPGGEEEGDAARRYAAGSFGGELVSIQHDDGRECLVRIVGRNGDTHTFLCVLEDQLQGSGSAPVRAFEANLRRDNSWIQQAPLPAPAPVPAAASPGSATRARARASAGVASGAAARIHAAEGLAGLRAALLQPGRATLLMRIVAAIQGLQHCFWAVPEAGPLSAELPPSSSTGRFVVNLFLDCGWVPMPGSGLMSAPPEHEPLFRFRKVALYRLGQWVLGVIAAVTDLLHRSSFVLNVKSVGFPYSLGDVILLEEHYTLIGRDCDDELARTIVQEIMAPMPGNVRPGTPASYAEATELWWAARHSDRGLAAAAAAAARIAASAIGDAEYAARKGAAAVAAAAEAAERAPTTRAAVSLPVVLLCFDPSRSRPAVSAIGSRWTLLLLLLV